MNNFLFLEESFPSLANHGKLAELYRDSDPNAALIKLGMIGETIVSLMFKYDKVREPRVNIASHRIDTLERLGFLPEKLATVLHLLRKERNKAAHEGWGDTETVLRFLPIVHSLAGWFAQTYGSQDLKIPTCNFDSVTVMPPEELERKEAQLQKSDETKAEQAQSLSKDERVSRASYAAKRRPKTEAETRMLIDEQLRNAGWEANTSEQKTSDLITLELAA